MELNCDLSAAIGYTSPSQISRVLSEGWLQRNGFCLACECETLEPTTNNTKACDFVCRVCNGSYELKTFRRKPTKRLIDGAYGALVARLQCGAAPTLILMERSSKWVISGLTAIHPMFLTPDIVEKRKPLSSTARRSGWVGCNIRLDLMGNDAAIEIIKGGIVRPRESVRKQFRRLNRLREVPLERRSWTMLTLSVLRTLQRSEFSLAEIYNREHLFSSVYPDNRNIRAKVRQQLQVLRDLGYLEFCGAGTYRLML
jgi:type II restriction enzyme